MNRSNQGSAHIVIIIIIILALLGALGFVFWQNFINKGAGTAKTETSSSSSQAASVKLMQGGVARSFPIPLTWQFPETWSLDSTGNGPSSPDKTANQTFTLTSPSGKVVVTYQVGVNGGVGGTCGDDTSTVKYVSQASVDGLPGGRFVEFISDQGNSSGYTYTSAITTDTADVRSAKEGTSSCFFGLGVVTLSSEHTYDLLDARITIKDLSDENGYSKVINDINTIQSAFKDSEYIQAKNILLSTKLGD